MVALADVRAVALTLPRSYEALLRGRVKFRVGRIVYVAASRDETLLGFAFPKEWREALVASEPHRFMLPRLSDLRHNWAVVRLDALDEQELHELVVDAWALVQTSIEAAAKLLSGHARRFSGRRRRHNAGKSASHGDMRE